ncbi:hypothetical protein DAEQUDRAFT_725293 [Daedalea quercina L-15889]|uniref:Uncharacterized protein n=1 Tax=Daedalea quercina L-15889 TaxID=1314783 RepID=A0A165R785_9APHY|nr:hypothetical protein DAEQUDRAFT_725293 [Daedalea quercina L-15889]
MHAQYQAQQQDVIIPTLTPSRIPNRRTPMSVSPSSHEAKGILSHVSRISNSNQVSTALRLRAGASQRSEECLVQGAQVVTDMGPQPQTCIKTRHSQD